MNSENNFSAIGLADSGASFTFFDSGTTSYMIRAPNSIGALIDPVK